MSRPGGPHAVLGLAPDADRAAVEAAYRRLIKQHHPDREGGDPETAKAIIQAYRLLTRGQSARLPVVVAAPPRPARAARPWRRYAVLALAAALAWSFPWPEVERPMRDLVANVPGTGPEEPGDARLPLLLQAQAKPDAVAVEAGVGEAERLSRRGHVSLVAYARSCADDLRRLPGEAMLDHCLAFDMAAARTLATLPTWLAPDVMAARHGAASVRIMKDEALAGARVREIQIAVERLLAEQPGYSPPAAAPVAPAVPASATSSVLRPSGA